MKKEYSKGFIAIAMFMIAAMIISDYMIMRTIFGCIAIVSILLYVKYSGGEHNA